MIVEFKSVTLTGHAKTQMRERDVTPEELAKALTHPQVVEPSGRCLRLVRDDLCAVVHMDDGGNAKVVTVLLRQYGQWTDADMRGRDDDQEVP